MFHTFNLKGYKLGLSKRLALHIEEEDGKEGKCDHRTSIF